MVEKSLKSGFHLFRFHQSQPDFLSFEVQFSSRASAYSFILAFITLTMRVPSEGLPADALFARTYCMF